MEEDAERVAAKALELFAAAWRKHATGYRGGTMAFLAAHVDQSISQAAKSLNVSGAAVIWAQDKFAEKAQSFLQNPQADIPSPPLRVAESARADASEGLPGKWWQFWK